MTAKVDIGFGEWLRRSCEHGRLLIPLIEMFILCFGVLWLPIIGWHLFLILTSAFLSALYYRYCRDRKNPPWYLMPVESSQEINDAKAVDN